MRASMKVLLLLTLALAATAFVLVGCQTTKGFGRDVEKLGENIQRK